MKKKNDLITYKEYLEKLSKNEICNILSNNKIEYKKSLKKVDLISIFLNNLGDLVKKSLSLFQIDEYHNIKYIIKKNGIIKIKYNDLLLKFSNNLVDNNLMIKIDDKNFQMPKEVFNIYKQKLNNKKMFETVKTNTEEYNLILGYIDAYGVISFDYFYQEYSKIYKYKDNDAKQRLQNMSDFFKEFKIFVEKSKLYISSNIFENLKECKKLMDLKKDYKYYTNEEIMAIHSFQFMLKKRNYKKLARFINRNYDINKGSMKVINRNVLVPFLEKNQIDKENSNELLSYLIDKFFEFGNEKLKNKFVKLANKLSDDYPVWNVKERSN